MPSKVASQQTGTSTRVRAGGNSQSQGSRTVGVNERDLSGTRIIYPCLGRVAARIQHSRILISILQKLHHETACKRNPQTSLQIHHACLSCHPHRRPPIMPNSRLALPIARGNCRYKIRKVQWVLAHWIFQQERGMKEAMDKCAAYKIDDNLTDPSAT